MKYLSYLWKKYHKFYDNWLSREFKWWRSLWAALGTRSTVAKHSTHYTTAELEESDVDGSVWFSWAGRRFIVVRVLSTDRGKVATRVLSWPVTVLLFRYHLRPCVIDKLSTRMANVDPGMVEAIKLLCGTPTTTRGIVENRLFCIVGLLQ